MVSDSPTSIAAKTGLPPGSLVHIGEVHAEQTRITVIDYSGEHLHEETVASIDQILPYRERDSVTWVLVEGLLDTPLIAAIGTHFNIHPLVLEDILNTHQRPKFEDYGDYLYFVLKDLSLSEGELAVAQEQISILVLDRLVFAFKEKRDDVFEPLRRQLHNGRTRIRSQGADYLAYAIIDTVVDRYFTLQDSFDELIEAVEERLLESPSSETLALIQRAKRELIFIRRSVSPLRDCLNAVLRSESALIAKATHLYFRDVQDHILRITESVEVYRDMITGLLDIYVSSVSNRMNETMKVLTVFATIFIPLTFLTGVYGMNFDHMPELRWKLAYPMLWVAFIGIGVALLIYFRRKNWL